jgi:hypothetical protein
MWEQEVFWGAWSGRLSAGPRSRAREGVRVEALVNRGLKAEYPETILIMKTQVQAKHIKRCKSYRFSFICMY